MNSVNQCMLKQNKFKFYCYEVTLICQSYVVFFIKNCISELDFLCKTFQFDYRPFLVQKLIYFQKYLFKFINNNLYLIFFLFHLILLYVILLYHLSLTIPHPLKKKNFKYFIIVQIEFINKSDHCFRCPNAWK